MNATIEPRPADGPEFRMFVGGEWVPSVTGRMFESRIPADRRDLIGRFQAGDAADVSRAIRAAGDSFPAETHLTFGGVKETGNGHREAGHAALDTYTEWRSIYVDFSGKLQRARIDDRPGDA